jgi:hypothetical protein
MQPKGLVVYYQFFEFVSSSWRSILFNAKAKRLFIKTMTRYAESIIKDLSAFVHSGLYTSLK